jgi:hypothetical protein
MYSRSAAISSALTSAAAEAVFDPIRRTSWQPSGTIVVTGTQDRQDLGCNSAVAGELVKSVLHHVERFRPRRKLRCILARALIGGVARQSEPAHNARQQ